MKNELQNILSGKSKVSFGNIIQTIACYLKDGESAGGTAESEKHFKKEETKRLEAYITEHHLWLNNIDLTQYVSEGAEQKVYLKDFEYVFKLNDAIYYNSWRDYFYNLLLHNFFFPDTAYDLIGFVKDKDILYAVVQQAYVSITHTTDLNDVKAFLTSNGFENTRNHDYYNPNLGIILEDLHDENVLTAYEVLYFIDTVFYINDSFWETHSQ